MSDSKKILLHAPAKINLFLEVHDKRSDGYHDITTIMQTISLCDKIEISTDAPSTDVFVKSASYLCGENNIAYAAIKAFFDFSGIKNPGVRITIDKRIPVSAGLGGGSANAAAVLKGLNILYNNILSRNALLEIGQKLGADVPFCIYGGTAVASGIGEILRECHELPECFMVIALSGTKKSTRDMYCRLDEKAERVRFSEEAMLNALSHGNLAAIGKEMYNVFSYVNSTDSRIKDIFAACGACGACVSGSGPSFAGLFENAQDAHNAENMLESIGIPAYFATPYRRNF